MSLLGGTKMRGDSWRSKREIHGKAVGLDFLFLLGIVGSGAALGPEGGVGAGSLVGSAEEEPKTAPRARPPARGSLAVPDVSLDVDLSRSGRVKSKGKDKVTRALLGGRIHL